MCALRGHASPLRLPIDSCFSPLGAAVVCITSTECAGAETLFEHLNRTLSTKNHHPPPEWMPAQRTRFTPLSAMNLTIGDHPGQLGK